MRTASERTFEGIVADHGVWIRRTLARLGVRAADLDDVMQEVLVAVWRGLPAFDPDLAADPRTALRAWLHGVCVRQAAGHRRTTAHQAEASRQAWQQPDGPHSGACDGEGWLLDRERSRLFMAAVAGLEPGRRFVVVRYVLDGRPMDEVAAQLGVPVNTAWNRLRLARADLRAVLGLPGPPGGHLGRFQALLLSAGSRS